MQLESISEWPGVRLIGFAALVVGAVAIAVIAVGALVVRMLRNRALTLEV
jgi:hypothetical protein